MENILNIREKRNGFVMIDNVIFENSNLSWKAKGLLGYLLSRPKNWSVNVKDLMNKGLGGKSSIYSGLKELTEYGHYKKIPVRENGVIKKWISYIFEFPEKMPELEIPKLSEPPIMPETEVPKIDNLETRTASLLTGFQDIENLHVENRGHSNTNCTNTNYNNNDMLSMIEKSCLVSSEKTVDKTRLINHTHHTQQVHSTKSKLDKPNNKNYNDYKAFIEDKIQLAFMKRFHSDDDKKDFRELCDIFVDIIVRNMLSNKRTIWINKTEENRDAIRDKFKNIDNTIFMFALNQYYSYNQRGEIRKPEQYILSCLYNAFIDSKLK